MNKKKRRRAPDPGYILEHTIDELRIHLSDLEKYEREEQEDLALIMDPAYTSQDGLYKGQTFSGARDIFISSHMESLEGIYKSKQITKSRIERIKRTNETHA